MTEEESRLEAEERAMYRLLGMARDIQRGADAIEEARYLREKLKALQQKYDELLSESLAHSQQISGAILNGILGGAITIPPKPVTDGGCDG